MTAPPTTQRPAPLPRASLTGVVALLRHESRVAALLTDLGFSSASVVARGMPQAAHPPLLGAVAAELGRPMLVVTAHPERAAELAENTRLWAPEGARVSVFPALEGLPYEQSDPEEGIIQRRQAVLARLVRPRGGGEFPVIICAARALLQPLMERQTFADALQEIRVGRRLPLRSAVQSWLNLGYSEAPMVERTGQFARRGGILDIYPAGEAGPLRVELFGDEVESLRRFDLTTQRSTADRSSCVVAPLHAFTQASIAPALDHLRAVDLSRALPHIQQKWLEDIARLAAGMPIEGLDFYAPFFTGEARSTILDYLPADRLVVIDEPEACLQAVDEIRAQMDEIHQELTGRGELPPEMPDPLFAPGYVLAALGQAQRLELRQRYAGAGEDPQPEQPHNAGGQDAPRVHDWAMGRPFALPQTYAGRLKDFLRDTADACRRGERVVVVSLQSARLAELYEEETDVLAVQRDHLTAAPMDGQVVLAHGALAEGWRAAEFELSVYSDGEIFGTAKARPIARYRGKPGAKAALDFQAGDYVVHIEHGIGRFQGVMTMKAGNVEREYLDIQYAGTDRLYVPTDQLDRVTRYVGMGETTPALSKLGTAEWSRAKAKVKDAVAETARELLELYSYREATPGVTYSADGKWQRELEASFPYVETPDQLKAINDVKADMESGKAMDRLVCGDVGYGKTEVALRAAFKATLDGKQVAILVPTTILAQQHYKNFKERMDAFPVRVEVVSRFQSRAEQKKILSDTSTGGVDILIGTHRLLQKDVQFKDLGLLVIDEEQRFGVKHKEYLKKMRRNVDVLTMTATPIPRSLHMAVVGVRDMSVIETAPEGRLPIKTYLQPFDEYHIREAILRELDRGGQIYFVHNRVQTIQAMAERLRRLVPEARVAIGHGQMPEDELEKVMFDFAAGGSDLLVCSSIIENGLDIPNVNTMIVNDATNFGLSQLYQLRGRIGRGGNRAYAYLLYRKDQPIGRIAERRLRAIFEATELGSGFKIAMRDLEIRGAGNLLGAEQSGNMATVGFDLYCKLLAQEIDEQRGRKRVQERQAVMVTVPLDMYLPTSYIPHESQRLAIYQRLAALKTLEELADMERELRDRFGGTPDEVANLLASLRLKLKAERSNITHVTLDDNFLILKGRSDVVYERMALYKRFGMAARITGATLRVPRNLLGADWARIVEEVLDEVHSFNAGAGSPDKAPAPAG